MANKVWVEDDIGYVQINSRVYGDVVAKVDIHRVGEILNHNWCVQATGRKELSSSYAVSHIDGKKLSMHQFLFPNCPEGLVRDHINGDGFDNRASNIRYVTQGHNAYNRRTRKYKHGVAWANGAFRVRLTVGGAFATEDEAHEAWKDAYIKVYGKLPDCVHAG